MIFLWAVAGALGAYRLAHLFTEERGPFDVCLWIRNHLAQDNWIGHGIRCLYCVSFWLAVGSAALIQRLFFVRFHAEEFFLLWFGMAGAVVLFDKYWKR